MTLRLIDHLCTSHAIQAQSRWPIAGGLADLFDRCHQCHHIAEDLHPMGTYSIRSLPDFDHHTYDQVTALHEAAHAVLGLAAGMPLNYAEIRPRTDEIDSGPGGCVNWGDYSIPIDKWAAMVWAGQRAQMRWLTASGLDTAANRVDVTNLGCDDTRRVLDAAGERNLPESIGWDLCADLLDLHELAIERVADALLAAGRLSGDEIAALSGVGCNA